MFRALCEGCVFASPTATHCYNYSEVSDAQPRLAKKKRAKQRSRSVSIVLRPPSILNSHPKFSFPPLFLPPRPRLTLITLLLS